MYANIVRLEGLRIPQTLLNRIGLRENDRVEISCQDDSITIRKAPRHRTLEERLTAFYGKPLDEIERIPQEELDWGQPEGEEAILPNEEEALRAARQDRERGDVLSHEEVWA